MTTEAPPELFVVGSGRSGTTIVLEAIGYLDDVATVPRLAGRIPKLTVIATRLAQHGLGPTSLVGPSAESTALFVEAGLTQGFQAALGRSVGPAEAGALHMDRLRRRLAAIRRHAKARTVAVKNTASCGRIPILVHTFPEAAFLHVLRHPAHVVSSLLRTDFWGDMILWWDGRTTQQYAREEAMSQAEVAARHWSRQVGTAMADLIEYAPRSMLLHYDAFVEQPVKALGQLEELGLRVAMTPELRERVQGLQIHKFSHREPVSAEVTAAVASECGDVATAMGLAL